MGRSGAVVGILIVVKLIIRSDKLNLHTFWKIQVQVVQVEPILELLVVPSDLLQDQTNERYAEKRKIHLESSGVECTCCGDGRVELLDRLYLLNSDSLVAVKM